MPFFFCNQQDYRVDLGASSFVDFVSVLTPSNAAASEREAAEFFILRRALLHPFDGLVEPLAGLMFLAELPVGHGQEEPAPKLSPSLRSSPRISP